MLKAENITTGHKGRVLLRDVSFTLRSGECVLLCGANGSGKSTLMRVLSGIDSPMGGRVTSDARTVMLPTRIPKVKGFTVREFIISACYNDTDILGRCDGDMADKVTQATDLLGIAHLADRDLSAISDGEFQKACTASAIARNAGILLLDEPTAFLDVDSRISVIGTLCKIAEEKNICVLFSSHDIHECSSACSRILGISQDSVLLDSDIVGKDKVLASCFSNWR